MKKTVQNAIDEQVESIKVNVATNNSKIDHISNKVNQLDIVSRANKLILSGVPEGETNNLDLAKRLCDIFNYQGVQVNEYDIVDAYRLRKKQNTSDGKPRLVLVELLSKKARNDIYSKRTALRNYKDNIFINEDLTPDNASLYYKVRQRANEFKLHSVWTRNGYVYYRSSKESVPIRVTSYEGFLHNFGASE